MAVEALMYPKLARVNIIYRFELGVLALQAISLAVLIVLLFIPNARDRMFGGSGLTVFAFVIVVANFMCESYLVFGLYKGIQEKDATKLAFWAGGNLLVALSGVIVEVILVIERSKSGLSILGLMVLLTIYHSVVIKLVYDAVKELRKNPINLPFVQMRTSEDQV